MSRCEQHHCDGERSGEDAAGVLTGVLLGNVLVVLGELTAAWAAVALCGSCGLVVIALSGLRR